jgi:hypothetical protein
MGFEVPVSDVGGGPRRGGRAVAAALASIVTVVAVAIVAGAVAPISEKPRNARPSVAGGQVATGPEQSIRPSVSHVVPPHLTCQDVDRATCQRMARAAVLVLPADAPEALDVTVWRSLLCNDTSDCPPGYLDGSAPLGSVIITFADRSPRAAVNVVEGRTGPIRRAARAWVVRWMPEPG